MKKYYIYLIIFSLLFNLFPKISFGLTFDRNNIISNEQFYNPDDMTANEVQKFLEKKGSFLATYTDTDIDGKQKLASAIIWRAAHDNGVNPKVILTLLQKEQSLIESSNPSQYNLDWATGFARCDSCSATDPKVIAYKGFVKQVEKAAWRKKYYSNNPWEFTFKAGLTVAVDGVPVTPKNSATAALYNYTPHLHGNYNFWKLWTRYFEKFYPDGMVVQEQGKKEIYLIQDGKKRLFSSLGVFLSKYNPKQIVSVTPGDLDKYSLGNPIKYAQYSLLRSPKGAVFLIIDDKKFGITSQKVFRTIGFNPEEITDVKQKDLDQIALGGFISKADINPVGQLLQDKKTGGVFYVINDIKQPIIAREILTVNFPYQKVIPTTSKELTKYKLGNKIGFKDGTLVAAGKGAPVYIISDGQKRNITSPEVFNALGLNWDNIVYTSQKVLDLHLDGEPLDMGKSIPDEMPGYITTASTKK